MHLVEWIPNTDHLIFMKKTTLKRKNKTKTMCIQFLFQRSNDVFFSWNGLITYQGWEKIPWENAIDNCQHYLFFYSHFPLILPFLYKVLPDTQMMGGGSGKISKQKSPLCIGKVNFCDIWKKYIYKHLP